MTYIYFELWIKPLLVNFNLLLLYQSMGTNMCLFLIVCSIVLKFRHNEQTVAI